MSPSVRRLVVPSLVLLLAASACQRHSEEGPVTSSRRPSSPAASGPTLADLRADQSLHGFRAASRWLDDGGQALGGRFVHERTGFVLDVLRIQSVPQAFTWVTTYPTSDMGEPHTQEHLLLGKGNVGRAVASFEEMALGSSSAFTQQERTCYHFNTTAGTDVFFELFEKSMNALLNPDYTDEEIRREVRNFGVTEDPATGTLRLEEKGTVYNEMVRAFETPFYGMWRSVRQAVYGEEHPLAYISGGLPAAIREMEPHHIRDFHRDHYHLANMGTILSLPRDVALADALERTSGMLDRIQPPAAAERLPVVTAADLPAPQTRSGAVMVAGFPHENPQQPGLMLFAWPPARDLSPEDRLLLELFVETVASDSTSTLYRMFVDSESRVRETGATAVFGWVDDVPGLTVYLGLDDVAAEHLTREGLEDVRALIAEELERVAAWPDDADDLVAFQERVRSRVVETRRQLSKFVSSPPRFGFRGNGSEWLDQLRRFEGRPGFDHVVTLGPQLEEIERRLAADANPWRELLPAWGLVNTVPVAGAARPSPELAAELRAERAERIRLHVAELQRRHATDDAAAAIAACREEYDAESARLEELAAQVETPRFIDDPPMTLDDQLAWERRELPGGVPAVVSTFEGMASSTVGLALDVRGVEDADLVYLALLPGFLTEAGIAKDGEVIPHDAMKERVRREILELSAYFSPSQATDRVELVVRGAGNDVDETRRAVEWMSDVLTHPDWRPENLPRLRDVADQAASALRQTLQGREESWARGLEQAWRRRDDPLFLTASAFATRAHHAHRLRWLLREVDPGARAATTEVLETLAQAGAHGGREELAALLAALQGAGDAPSGPVGAAARRARDLPAPAAEHLGDAADDLEQLLPDLPDATLTEDWAYLCRQLRTDLLRPPAETLADLHRVREGILRRGDARVFVIGSSGSQQALEQNLGELAGVLAEGRSPAARRSTRTLGHERVGERSPTFVGLVNPNTQGGLFLMSAPCARYSDTDRESLLDYLSSKLYAGGGAHGLFMRTWGAGLAYSNGMNSSPRTGLVTYYAERCPELPQTLRFVIGELEKAQADPFLVEYAVAQSFGSRAASRYEERGESMASDLADGVTPELVRASREALLALRADPDLERELFERLPQVAGRVLPGLGPASASVEGATYLVVGPESQLSLHEAHLKSAEGEDAVLVRIHVRDLWLPAAPGEEGDGSTG